MTIASLRFAKRLTIAATTREARRTLASGIAGTDGESNELRLRGRGVFICISRGFPLAIFTGQIAGALAAGNCVVAKPPSRPTHCIRGREAPAFGRCRRVHLILCRVMEKSALCSPPTPCRGVAFTGSTEVARAINRARGEDGHSPCCRDGRYQRI